MTDNNFTLTGYPHVMVQDCATHPEDIDTAAMWILHETADDEPEGGMTVRNPARRNTKIVVVLVASTTLLFSVAFSDALFHSSSDNLSYK